MELLFRYYNGEMVSLGGGDDDEEEEEESGDETPSESDDDDVPTPASSGGALLHREALRPRKKLPPLLLPLSAVPTPRLDWLGTSFGLTPSLHNFWSRKVGMTLLYLRQTPNELTGEHSAVMIRALPRRSGWDDAWLPAFGVDARRRIGRLLGGAFRGMEVGLAVSLLGDVVGGYHSWMKKAGGDKTDTDDATHDGNANVDKAAVREVRKRSGVESARLSASELHYHLTPHDLQRLELYGRNLCDHHLISDLVPSLAQLYFTSRMGPGFRLSSVQAALLCGVGLQSKSADDLASELGLPINQVLAMFNKAVRKMSLSFRGLLAEEEGRGLLGGDAVARAESTGRRMRDVAGRTLDEDAAEGAADAMRALERAGTRMTPEIADPEIMRYALRGTDEEWAEALGGRGRGRDVVADGGGTVQVRTTAKARKRKAGSGDGGEEDNDNTLSDVMKNDRKLSKKGGSASKKKSKKSKKKSKQ